MKLIAKQMLKIEKEQKEKEGFPGDEISVTRHVLHVNGKPLRYKAVAGYMKMKDENQKLKSRIFYISYEKECEDNGRVRPLTFAFNGGPGSASPWVHFGTMGPKRVKMSDDGETLPPPYYEFLDNEQSWLQHTDLVFIDPIGTGFSRHEQDEKPEQFYGVQEDFKWVGDFIRLYITQNNRWLSPKFIAGESYGTFRAVGLAKYLQDNYGMDMNGLIFISSALNYLTFILGPGNDLPHILFLPTYTASAFYHKKLAPNLQENLQTTLREVEDWAINCYAPALLKGDALSSAERTEIIEKLSRYTSLPAEYIDENNLRISGRRFQKQLLRKERMVLGLYDSRFTGIEPDPSGDNITNDPSKFMLFGAYVSIINDYIRRQLNYTNDLPYAHLSRNVGRLWNWESGLQDRMGMGYVDVSETLRDLMCYNKYFKVFFANGYYDLCTPYFVNRYTSEHLGIPPVLRDNVIFKCYEAGHMMYIHTKSRKKLYEDVGEFFNKCVEF